MKYYETGYNEFVLNGVKFGKQDINELEEKACPSRTPIMFFMGYIQALWLKSYALDPELMAFLLDKTAGKLDNLN